MKQATKEKLKKFLSDRRAQNVFFVALALGMGFYLGWLWSDVLAFGIFVFIIIHPIPARWLAVPALILLIMTPIFLTLLDRKNIAEELAVNAFYFLVMAVMMGTYELRRDERLQM